MAKKSFPFSVCEKCCGGSGGDNIGIEPIILKNSMNQEEIISAINNADKGTIFDIQSKLVLGGSIAFPENSTIYSSNGEGEIECAYDDNDEPVESVAINFGNRSTVMGISFDVGDGGSCHLDKGCTAQNCIFGGSYSVLVNDDECIFINCDLGSRYDFDKAGCVYINCSFGESDFREAFANNGYTMHSYLSGCIGNFHHTENKAFLPELAAQNPRIGFYANDGIEEEPLKNVSLYTTREYVDSQIGLALEGKY